MRGARKSCIEYRTAVAKVAFGVRKEWTTPLRSPGSSASIAETVLLITRYNLALLGGHAAHVHANFGELRPEDCRGYETDHAADRHRRRCAPTIRQQSREQAAERRQSHDDHGIYSHHAAAQLVRHHALNQGVR